MNRRSTLKTLLIISTGAALLPSCLPDEKKSSISLKNIKINGKDEELLSDLSETIIPKTNTPGAKDVSAHLFTLMMIDYCYAPADQDKFVKGLKEFEDFSKKKFDKSFLRCFASERAEILKSIESKKDIPENVAFFYNTTKRLVLQAFTKSKYYLTKVQVYELVPGKFYGCVPVKKAS
ncbi:gluconate 2-dehydrogenase subunit 3 family protein [Ginsengibacter hankyongi]|uniref:Gluconate 2-dehydrogenase subunit 3 family protein n=1 Tax=Ginsengibacter hankyongi TaxID=2607284 RepID=A0A5J5IF95_9BACT|nr:gluconate 2-dehydrogenase subunit 3 family protein [Ginsengibacter hankyongi]KAA9037750.1 gluconate 2-dehydrogenase subunit 3 family protein [Ginsengibacter hankyongi]